MRSRMCRQYAVAMFTPLLAIVLLAGCDSHHERHARSRDFFPGEQDARIVRQTANHQTMLGAQADPTLYGCHFDGNSVNGLGRAKLDAILADGAPAKIYIASAKDSADAHRAAVNSYLAAAKVADGSVAIESGAAPDASSPAAPAMARMSKTESPRMSSASNETSANNSRMTSSNR